MFRNLSVRLSSLFRRERFERELDTELRYHIDMLTEQNVRKGMTPDAARREAQRVFGPVAGIKDDVRDSWLSRFVEVAAQDVRYGLRSLRRNPGFALVIIVTMALGIGANTAIFSVVNGVLLRPLPYKDGGKLIVLHHGQGDPITNDFGFSPMEIDDYRQARSLSDVVEFHNMFFNLLGRAEPERLSTGVVSANYFDVLGVQPRHGRTFVAADDAPGAPAVLVLSHKYWERSFGGDPNVVGQVFRMNDRPHTVIGVLPPVPQYPLEVDVYMPTSACPFRSNPANIARRQFRLINAVFARVRPEVTLEKSQADLDIVAAQLQTSHKTFYPQTGFKAVGVPLKEDLTRGFTSTLWVLLGTAGFVLLIVCASIANLLLARMVRREREISVRAALGATRARLMRQLLTESLILAVAGGLLGLVLSALSLRLLVAFAERFTARANEIAIDMNVLLFTLGASVLTGLIFGSIPAFSRRVDVAPALREGGRASHGGQRVRSALIVAQVSASFMLLIAAGLTLRSLLNVQGVNPGITTENLVAFRADMSFDKFPLTLPPAERTARIGGYWTEFEQRLRAIPGVVDLGGGGTFPLNEQGPFATGLIREGRTYPEGAPAPRVSLRVATPDYFKTLGQPLVAGRPFAPSDTFEAPSVVIVNQTAAKQFWPNEDPLGTRLVGGRGGFRTIVGVVADVRQQLDREPAAEVYVPMPQFNLYGTTWVVHSRLPLEEATRAFKSVARAHDADLPVANFRTLAEVRADGLAPRRVIVTLIGLFGLLALVITAAGIAGVIAFSVNQRTQEFGVRMALGAPRAGVLALVIREGLLLVSIGLALGLGGALALTKVLGAVIFDPAPTSGLVLLVGTQALDTITYVGVGVILLIVAMVACLMPARRAASVDPMVALRAQ
jgi:putative ABC transport system permease protein